jgi:hypothetical protein
MAREWCAGHRRTLSKFGKQPAANRIPSYDMESCSAARLVPRPGARSSSNAILAAHRQPCGDLPHRPAMMMIRAEQELTAQVQGWLDQVDAAGALMFG